MRLKKIVLLSLLMFQLWARGQSPFYESFQNLHAFLYITQGMGAQVLQASDSGLVIVGINIKPASPNTYDFCLIKTNASGDTLWTKIYGTPHNENTYRCIQVADGGFAISGASDANPCLIRTDHNGDTLWTRTYYHSNLYSSASIAHNLKQTSDGGFILVGAVASASVLLIKTDASGNLTWSKEIEWFGIADAYAVFEVPGSGYILAGSTANIGGNSSDFYVIRTDLSGTPVWAKTYGGSNDDLCFSMVEAGDGGYVLSGWSQSFSSHETIFLIKIDSSGNLVWSKNYDEGVSARAYYISKSISDNGFIVSGSSGPYAGSLPYILKLDANGDSLWTRIIDTNSVLCCAIETMDHGFAGLAWRNNILSLLKTDPNGNSCYSNSIHLISVAGTPSVSVKNAFSGAISYTAVGTNFISGAPDGVTKVCSNPASVKELSVNSPGISLFPNPFSSELTIRTEELMQNASIVIVNGIGQTVKILHDISGYSTTLQRGGLPAGLYFVRLVRNYKTTTAKLIVSD